MVYELFHTRYSLFKQVYSHRVSKAIEYMVTDVLLLADPHLHLSDAIHSASAYLTLTDAVLRQIEYSTEPELADARALLLRIRQRKLYRLVEEAIIPIHLSDMDDVTAEELLAYQQPVQSPQLLVRPEEVVVENLRIHYAMREKNPVDAIRFFDKSDLHCAYFIPKQKVSHVMPAHFHERILRVFIKDIEERDPLKPRFLAVKAATIAWLRAHECVSPVITRTASGVLLRKGHSFLKHAADAQRVSAPDDVPAAIALVGPSLSSSSSSSFAARASSGSFTAVEASVRRLRDFARIDEAAEDDSASPEHPQRAALNGPPQPQQRQQQQQQQQQIAAQGRGERKRRRDDSIGGSSVSSSGSEEAGTGRMTAAVTSSPPSRRAEAGAGYVLPWSSVSSPSPSPGLPPSDGSPASSPFPSLSSSPFSSADVFVPHPHSSSSSSSFSSSSLSSSSRRTSMDPPSPLLSHPHAHYHVNPTLACHFPTSLLVASPPPASPPQRSSSPSPSPSAPSSHRQLSEWKRLKGMDGLLTGAAAVSGPPLSPHLSPHSPLSPAVHRRSAASSSAFAAHWTHGHAPSAQQQQQQQHTLTAQLPGHAALTGGANASSQG